MRAVRHSLLLIAVAFACFPLSACAGEASFEHGVIGVRLSDRVGEYSAWSPDGRWIAEPARVGFRLRNVGSGKVRELHAPTYQGFPERSGRLDWSGDGKTIRYATSEPRPENGNASWLTEVSLDGSGYRHQTLGVRAQRVSWAADGYPLAFSTGAYALDFEKGPIGPKPSLFVVDEFGATPRRVAFIPHPKREEEIGDPAISPDGRQVAYERWGAHHNVNIWTVRADGSNPKPLVPSLVSAYTVEWAPNGRTLALGAFTAKGDRRQHVYTVPAAGGKPRRIVTRRSSTALPGHPTGTGSPTRPMTGRSGASIPTGAAGNRSPRSLAKSRATSSGHPTAGTSPTPPRRPRARAEPSPSGPA